MNEPVNSSYKLPPEVLALLGDDATPERVASGFEGLCQEETAAAIDPKCAEFKNMHSGAAFDYALAAAAIRECEARRKCGEHSVVDALECDGCKEKSAAWAAYDALRNWRKP